MFAVNGTLGIDARLTMPRIGLWTMDARIDTATPPEGAVTIDIDDGTLTLKGYVARGGDFVDTGYLRIVGGAGGMQKTATPRHFTSPSLRVVLSDLLTGAGETLAASSTASVLARVLEAWTTAALPTGAVFARAVAVADPAAAWRALANGTIWIGLETWPTSTVDDDVQILDEDPTQGAAVVGAESPLVTPGTVLGGRRVSYVEHQLAEATRTRVIFEDGAERMRRAVRGFVGGALGPIDYSAMYLAEVVTQAGGFIDLRPLDPRIPTMAKVPLLGGFPGWTLDGATGGLALVGWSGGDPSHRYALGFSSSSAATRLIIEATAQTFGTDAVAEPMLKAATFRTAQAAANVALMAAAAAGQAAAVGPLSPLAPFFAAMQVALQTFEAAASGFLSTQTRNS